MEKQRIQGKYESPAGALTIVCTMEGVKTIRFQKEKSALYSAEKQNSAEYCRLQKMLEWTMRELQEYFEGKRKEFTVPLAMEGTEFQKKVWNALLKIPYGQTCSYKEIAIQIGSPGACRAVGMANNRNPIPILVPCHRVIGADGRLTGYAGGLDMKEKLLKLERENREAAERKGEIYGNFKL